MKLEQIMWKSCRRSRGTGSWCSQIPKLSVFNYISINYKFFYFSFTIEMLNMEEKSRQNCKQCGNHRESIEIVFQISKRGRFFGFKFRERS